MFLYSYDFSIVMGYYNRKKQIINTLNDFENKYKKYNYEVIIVDDNSSEEHKLDDIVKRYTFPIKYIVITPEEKGNRINPCITYNRGIREASGKYLIIQNPECMHVGNLLEYTKNNLTEKDYMAFSCYTANNENFSDQLVSNINLINNLEFRKANSSIMQEWYNHPKYRPVHYHFCAAILNENMKMLGGFDKKFAEGHSYDDNEILLSIEKNLKLTIKTIPPENRLVIHQWHARDAENKFNRQHFLALVNKNKNLYEKYVYEHNKYNFNYPKLLHLYWDGTNFSFLNLLTVLSFNKHHFGWKIHVYCPINPVKTKSWTTSEQKYEYTGRDYFNRLKEIDNVFIHNIDFNNIPFKYKDASEVIKSDYFRLYILNKYGGLWSDFDIIYVNNIEEYYSKKQLSKERNVILYRYWWKEWNKYIYPVGLFLCNRNNSVFDIILKNIEQFYNPTGYQCLGCQMFHYLFSLNSGKKIINQMNLPELCMDNADIYLSIKWNETGLLYKDKKIGKEQYQNNKNIIGIHWFNGANESKVYCNDLDKRISDKMDANCLVDKLVKEYI